MRLHPVSWLLIGVLAFVLVDAAVEAATYFALWKNAQTHDSTRLAGAFLGRFYSDHGDFALGSFVWTIGMVVSLEILWRTLRGLRLRRIALGAEG